MSHNTLGEDPYTSFDQSPEILNRGFDKYLGLEFTGTSTESITAQLHVQPHHHQPHGIVHGGVYCAIVESVGSYAGVLWLRKKNEGTPSQNAYCVGVNNSTHFFRPFTTGMLYCTSSPIHRGKSQQLWQVNIKDDQGRLIAKGDLRLHNIYPE